jgi:hypothetical protein
MYTQTRLVSRAPLSSYNCAEIGAAAASDSYSLADFPNISFTDVLAEGAVGGVKFCFDYPRGLIRSNSHQ